LDGAPCVDISPIPGFAPPILTRLNLIARPIVALARQQGPYAPDWLLSPIFSRMGPLIIKSGAQGWVVAWIAYRLNAGSDMALNAAAIIGKYSGRQPAITALIANFSTVAAPQLGGTSQITWSAGMSEHESISCTRSGVGGVIGSPSVQPRSR
jgi:hypothetical protein